MTGKRDEALDDLTGRVRAAWIAASEADRVVLGQLIGNVLARVTEVTHLGPAPGSSVMQCCGMERSQAHGYRVTFDRASVTCPELGVTPL